MISIPLWNEGADPLLPNAEAAEAVKSSSEKQREFYEKLLENLKKRIAA